VQKSKDLVTVLQELRSPYWRL